MCAPIPTRVWRGILRGPLFRIQDPVTRAQPGIRRSAGVESEETADRLGAGDPDPLIADEIGCV